MSGLPEIGAQGDPRKWGMPGWRVEPKYDNQVLIGNWYEERRNFDRTPQSHNTTHRRDFKSFPTYRPDVVVRRNAFLTNKGLPKNLLFGHHGKAYSNNMITWYDENFNKRPRPVTQTFPKERFWDSKTLSWAPEKSDYPLQGEPTNWGLKSEVEARQAKQEEELKISDWISTYKLSFLNKPIDTTQCRYAQPRSQSTQLHRPNKTNQNLKLRNVTVVQPQMPQNLQILHPYQL